VARSQGESLPVVICEQSHRDDVRHLNRCARRPAAGRAIGRPVCASRSPPKGLGIIDDDGTGEIADLVALRRAAGRLHVRLVHCKYAPRDTKPGARVSDLYELCGQAQKSARWRGRGVMLFRQLIRRERNRVKRHGHSGLMRGMIDDLYRLEDEIPLLRPEMDIWAWGR
jgi:hypothetical protein